MNERIDRAEAAHNAAQRLRIQTISEEVEELFGLVAGIKADLIDSEAESMALREQLRIAAEALEQHGSHDAFCNIPYLGTDACTCGLDAALSKLQERT